LAFAFLIGVHIVAMVIIGLMLGSCLVSYAPTMSVADVQNSIFKNLLFLALVGFGVHVYGIAVLFGMWRRTGKPK